MPYRWNKDIQLGAAFLVAPIVWLALYLTGRPGVDLLWPIDAPGLFLMLVLVYPVLEEIVFRGLIQGWLIRQPLASRQWRGISLANGYTSALFAAT